MKKLLLIIFAVLFANINAQTQDKCSLKVDVKSGQPMLVGIIDREAFADTNFAWWYNSGYENYDVDSVSLDKIRDKLKDYEIKIVMGTWCSDSRREVPRFFKILDYLDYPKDKVEMVAVDRDLKSPVGDVDKLDIKRIPDFILSTDFTEVGRIVESPKETLEKDLDAIILK